MAVKFSSIKPDHNVSLTLDIVVDKVQDQIFWQK